VLVITKELAKPAEWAIDKKDICFLLDTVQKMREEQVCRIGGANHPGKSIQVVDN
jgi:hypothetical protein